MPDTLVSQSLTLIFTLLRHQPDSLRAVDLISSVANYIDAVTPCINRFIIGHVTMAMAALSEFVQVCQVYMRERAHARADVC